MTVPHVYTAISEVTAKLAKVGISKDKRNVQQKYDFRGIDDVYNALATCLPEAKLLILPRVKSREVSIKESQKDGKTTVLFYVAVAVEFDFISAVDGSIHTICTYGEAMDGGDKATNKALSAAYKYAAIQSFCIPTEGESGDADYTTHSNIQPETSDDEALATGEMKAKILAAGVPNGWTSLDVARYIEQTYGYSQDAPAPLTVSQARDLFGHVASCAPEVPA